MRNQVTSFDFKIRLAMYPDREVPAMFVDELPEIDRALVHRHLHGEYDWLDRTEGETKGSREYEIQQNIMAQNGFTNDDIVMDVMYVDGKFHVSVITDKDFNEIRTCVHHGTSYKMTLLDCVKDVINGQLSDGIGENEIGRYKYKGVNYDIWLGILETDEETENNQYFKTKIIKE